MNRPASPTPRSAASGRSLAGAFLCFGVLPATPRLAWAVPGDGSSGSALTDIGLPLLVCVVAGGTLVWLVRYAARLDREAANERAPVGAPPANPAPPEPPPPAARPAMPSLPLIDQASLVPYDPIDDERTTVMTELPAGMRSTATAATIPPIDDPEIDEATTVMSGLDAAMFVEGEDGPTTVMSALTAAELLNEEPESEPEA